MDSKIKVKDKLQRSAVCLLFSLLSNSDIHQHPVQTVPAKSCFTKGFADALQDLKS